ncbi:hypothetical protein ISN76_19090 [Dyella halodurans]|uniref:DUF1877 family protein n=1 Tax=Dyella halodurans TaxID=1920171 RepID=A0ABV9C0E5_9GAMM|nr:hypothetical protein [Dyella halodurans]
MAGLHISCGTFSGDDKSGSAFEAVLKALGNVSDDLVPSITSGFETSEFVTISATQAEVLLPALIEYRKALVEEIGHQDWRRATADDEKAGLDPVKAKWGQGNGWRLYCVTDLIAACKTAVTEHQEVVVVLC